MVNPRSGQDRGSCGGDAGELENGRGVIDDRVDAGYLLKYGQPKPTIIGILSEGWNSPFIPPAPCFSMLFWMSVISGLTSDEVRTRAVKLPSPVPPLIC
jgi:hypothetical protein